MIGMPVLSRPQKAEKAILDREKLLISKIDAAYEKAAQIADAHGSPIIAAAIREEGSWEGLSCSCGGGWRVGHAFGCPEDVS